MHITLYRLGCIELELCCISWQIETDEMIAKVEGNAAAADDDDVQLMFSDRSGEDRFIVDDDKEQYEKRHASMGKKIWTFFTT